MFYLHLDTVNVSELRGLWRPANEGPKESATFPVETT